MVAAIANPGKNLALFDLDERRAILGAALDHLPNVRVVAMATLTVDVARAEGADVIVKGLRVASDFEYELQQAQMNKAISGIETVFLPCGSASSFIASSLVRQIAKYGGADRVGSMVPPVVARRLKEKFAP